MRAKDSDDSVLIAAASASAVALLVCILAVILVRRVWVRRTAQVDIRKGADANEGVESVAPSDEEQSVQASPGEVALDVTGLDELIALNHEVDRQVSLARAASAWPAVRRAVTQTLSADGQKALERAKAARKRPDESGTCSVNGDSSNGGAVGDDDLTCQDRVRSCVGQTFGA